MRFCGETRLSFESFMAHDGAERNEVSVNVNLPLRHRGPKEALPRQRTRASAIAAGVRVLAPSLP